jgi:hypothetical protein
MDSSTLQTLETIRKRIANLQQVERTIVTEFSDSPNGTSNGTGDAPVRRRRARKRTAAPHPTATSGISRKAQIHNWLKAHGPAYRSEVIEGTGFPQGTVGSYLSQCPDLFESRDGKWVAK